MRGKENLHDASAGEENGQTFIADKRPSLESVRLLALPPIPPEQADKTADGNRTADETKI